jgi:hypothetical protein
VISTVIAADLKGTSMSILLISDIVDYHTAAIRWALETRDFQIHQWEGLGHEEARQASIELLPHPRVHLGGFVVEASDTVWYRRPLPFSLNPKMARVDRRFVYSEARRFNECLDAAIELVGCRCINSPSAAWIINKKAIQLYKASKSGLCIPETLMGNESERVSAFLSTQGGRKIYKGFMPHVWENSQTGMTAFAQTSEVSINDERMRDTLTYSPGIYQQLINKRYDVRVMVMGPLIRAFMIRSDVLDWRIDAAYGRAHAEEISIPDGVLAGIRNFMSSAGVIFGCLDFAVDQAGDWWFLEINESGQFLWIDQMLPDAGVFEDFLAFLTGAERQSFPSLKDFTFDLSTIPNRIAEKPEQVTVER